MEDLRASFREEIELSARITQGKEAEMNEEELFSPISHKSTRSRLSMSVVEESSQLCRYFFSSRPLSLHSRLGEAHIPFKPRPQRFFWLSLFSLLALLSSFLCVGRMIHC